MKVTIMTACAVACGIALSAVAMGWDATLTSESGGVEVAGFVVFAIAAGFAAWQIGARGLRRWWPVPAMLILFCLRELDIHDSLFEVGVLQTRIFVSDVPPWQKGVAAAVMLCILWAVLRLIYLGLPPAMRALRAGQGWILAIIGGLAMGAGATLLDGLDRKLVALGLPPTGVDGTRLVMIEELLELGFALSLVLAIELFCAAKGRVRPSG